MKDFNFKVLKGILNCDCIGCVIFNIIIILLWEWFYIVVVVVYKKGYNEFIVVVLLVKEVVNSIDMIVVKNWVVEIVVGKSLGKKICIKILVVGSYIERDWVLFFLFFEDKDWLV